MERQEKEKQAVLVGSLVGPAEGTLAKTTSKPLLIVKMNTESPGLQNPSALLPLTSLSLLTDRCVICVRRLKHPIHCTTLVLVVVFNVCLQSRLPFMI